MLVPDQDTCSRSRYMDLGLAQPSAEKAAITISPGATISGFRAPFSSGPRLEKADRSPTFRYSAALILFCESIHSDLVVYEPTQMTLDALDGDMMVLSPSPSSKNAPLGMEAVPVRLAANLPCHNTYASISTPAPSYSIP